MLFAIAYNENTLELNKSIEAQFGTFERIEIDVKLYNTGLVRKHIPTGNGGVFVKIIAYRQKRSPNEIYWSQVSTGSDHWKVDGCGCYTNHEVVRSQRTKCASFFLQV